MASETHLTTPLAVIRHHEEPHSTRDPRQLDVWSRRLRGVPVSVDLPTDRPASPTRVGHASQRVTVALPRASHRDACQLADAVTGTTRDVWLAAFVTQLHRYATEPDVAVAVAGPEGATAARFHLDAEASFRDCVRQATAERDHAERIGEVSVADIQRALRLPDTAAGERASLSAVYDVAARSQPAGMPAHIVLAVDDDPRHEAATIRLDYDPALFDVAGAERLCLHYATLVAAALAEPDRPIGRLSLLPAAERRALQEFNTTDLEHDPTRSLAVCVAEIAAATPDAVALAWSNGKLCYGELDARANQLARHLVGLGLAPGERAALLWERSPDFVIGLLGVLKAGAAAVLLDPAHPDPSLAAVLGDARPRVVLTRAGLAARVPTDLSADVVCCDRDVAVIEQNPARPYGQRPDPDDVGLVFYTSGSTGEPKGVMIRHQTISNVIAWTRAAYQVTAADRASWLSSPGFAIAAQEWIPMLALGGTVCVADPQTAQTPESTRDWLIDCQVTFCVLVAPFAERMWALPWPAATPLRLMFATGAPVRSWAPENLPFDAVVFYATTETLVTTSCYNAHTGLRAVANAIPSPDRRPPPLLVGRPAANTRVHILDAARNPTPIGVIGELHVAGAGVAAGYLGKPELTAEHFIANPLPEEPSPVLCRTGDLARWGADGLIEIVGRIDHAVKIRGYRVEPATIENALEALPSVRGAAVVAREDVPGDTRLVAYLVAAGSGSVPGAAGGPPSPAELRAALAERLPHYMTPSRFVILDELPRLPNGKLDRQGLPAPIDSRSEAGADGVAPRTATEAAVAAQVSLLLGQERVGAHDDFFDLGGHSLAAVDLLAYVNARHGVRLTLNDLYATPTVAGLAGVLEASHGDMAGHVEDGSDTVITIEPDPSSRYQPFPLTDSQHALWVGRGDAVELGNVGCHGYFEWQSQHLDVERLRRAWQRLVDRHDALRLVIRPDGMQQVLHDPPPCRIPVLDLREEAPSDADAAALALREELSHQILPADRPLFDVRITLLPGEKVRLHLSFDLLITDAWSYVQVLLPDLVRFYQDPDAEREPLQLTFRDYVVGVGTALETSEACQRSRRYWLDRLATLPPAPDLPSAQGAPVEDGPALPGQTGAGAGVRFARRADRLEPAAWQLLRRRSRERGITPTCLLIATFSEVLRNWSANDQFTINCPLFNRLPGHPQINQVVGDFTTMSLLAVEQTDGTFTERARSIQKQMWDDLEHRHFNGIRVLRELNRRSGSGARNGFPVVVTSILGQPPRHSVTALGEAVHGISQTPQVTLDFQIWEDEAGLRYNWDSLDALFPPGMLDDMFEAHRALLNALVEDERTWSQRRLALTPRRQLELREKVNDTAAPLPDRLLHTALGEHASRHPDRPAVITSRGRLTYAELSWKANQVGRGLRALGVRPHQLVAVVMGKSAEQIVAVYGVLAAGAAYLPLDASVPEERLRSLLVQGEVDIVLTRSADDAAIPWPPGVRRLLIDQDFDAEDGAALPPAQRASDLAYVIFTSGSTGVPKGVMVDHRGARNTIVDINTRFGVGADDRCLGVSELYFDLSVYDVFGMIDAGGALVLPDPTSVPNPGHWAELMEREQVTFLSSAPVLLEMMVGELERRRKVAPAPPLRVVVTAGDWIPVSLPGRLRGLCPRAQFIASGGPTETCVLSVIYPVGDVNPAWNSIPYGRPMTNQRYHVLDRWLRPRPTWVPGEIHIASDVGLAQGYWRDEERTAQQFINLPETGERAYASGDVGRYLPDGNIEFLGREDFQVKIQGIRVELGEIEATLGQHPAVRSAVVVADAAVRDLPVLHAYVTWQDRTPPGSPDELRQFLADRLPSYMTPRRISVLEQLPLTRNGKVDRQAMINGRLDLEQGFGGADSSAHVEPATSLERLICAVWAELLGAPRVGMSDDFFSLGGNSLTATKLITELRELLGVELSLQEVLLSPTPADVAVSALSDPATRASVLALADELDQLTPQGIQQLGASEEL